ncbi:hypothetical protein AAFF_G00219290 [Aldrovandia affinis]|uniref:Uncharacterized protein n=1 Tax=Aldrovandia affinis TaxID=143900 RepID=A0AAD7W5F7_9TELE|nr:hypothetical protein AAFF_G00219290 [Aldrovandia affinis]
MSAVTRSSAAGSYRRHIPPARHGERFRSPRSVWVGAAQRPPSHVRPGGSDGEANPPRDEKARPLMDRPTAAKILRAEGPAMGNLERGGATQFSTESDLERSCADLRDDRLLSRQVKE